MVNPANPDCIIMERELTVDEIALIDLIEYYRDEYHRADWCHTDMINKIKNGTDPKTIEMYWKITDGWLDND